MQNPISFLFFFFNDPPTPEISPLPLHDALPISRSRRRPGAEPLRLAHPRPSRGEPAGNALSRSPAVGHQPHQAAGAADPQPDRPAFDRRSARKRPPLSAVAYSGRVSGPRPPPLLRLGGRLHGRLWP